MNERRYELLLFIIVLVIVVSYSAVLIVRDNIHKPEPGGVYEYLSKVESFPNLHMFVVGKNAQEYEVEYGKQIAEHFNLGLRYEQNVVGRRNMILFGSPSTNFLLDKLLLENYDSTKPKLIFQDNNFLVIVNNEKDANEMYEILSSYKEERAKLSPAAVTLGFSNLILYSIIAIVILLPILIIDLEIRRKRELSKAKEEKTEHKIEAIHKYVQKYVDEGHSKEQIRDWLSKYGYKNEMIDVAMEEVDNAGATVSN